MTSTAKYFHDRLILLLLSTNVFLALANSIFVLVQLSSNHGNGYIVQCRDCSNIGNINRFTNGGVGELLAFIVFALAVAVIHIVLSLRTYRIHRQLAVIILALGTLLLIMTAIVGNALLVLR
ncbi:MAG TPA: hypothetical protein VFH39_02750 [Candidatus Saccharimonadales bacterium]|nr:hypothetical protein [Candidatus Saccharimonadales bacterium]